MLLFLGEYLHAKTQAYLCVPSGNVDDQRTLSLDESILPKTYEEEFAQIWFCTGKQGF